MDNMLDPSFLKDDNIKYNDDIAYVKGDDVYAEHQEEYPETYYDLFSYKRYAVTKATREYDKGMIYKQIIHTKNETLDDTRSFCESKYLTITEEDLKDFKNIAITTDDPITEESFNNIKDSLFDSIRYSATVDTLYLPAVIKHFIEKDGSVNVKVSVFNYYLAETKHSLFKDFGKKDMPIFNLQYIPNLITYSQLVEPVYKTICYDNKYPEMYCLYTNLPSEIYTKHIIETMFLYYSDIEEHFYCRSSNQTKINTLCKDMATNGIKTPIPIKLLKDGSIRPLLGNKRLLTSCYLNLPTIPVCLIFEPMDFDYEDLFKKQTPNKELLQKIISPYFELL